MPSRKAGPGFSVIVYCCGGVDGVAAGWEVSPPTAGGAAPDGVDGCGFCSGGGEFASGAELGAAGCEEGSDPCAGDTAAGVAAGGVAAGAI